MPHLVAIVVCFVWVLRTDTGTVVFWKYLFIVRSVFYSVILRTIIWPNNRKYLENIDGKAENNVNWEINLYTQLCLYSLRIN